MASGSSGRANAGSKGFDFASDDILCPYEDYPNQESSNGSLSDPVISASSGKDFHNRRARSPVYSAAAYTQPEDSFNQDVISVVEKSMKRNTENLMRFLEGISSRLSQLELYCYNLDKSIGEMRSDLVRDHGESDSKLKAIEKHLQEVHRSVQILRDKQELADTQKELAKLQLGQKDSTSSTHSQSTEGRASPTISESKKNHNQVDSNNQQLALALPHQVAPAQPPPPPAPTQNVPQQPAYYLPAPQLPNPPVPPPQHQQPQYVSPDSQYPRVAQQQAQPQVNQTPPVQQYPQYPPQPLPQQVQLPQQPPMQTQLRPQSHVYPSYVPGQATNPPPETLPNSMPMQVPYPGIPQPGTSCADVVPFGYAGPGRASQQQPSPQIKGGYGAQPGDGYGASGPHPALPPGSTYMMYDGEGNRAHYQPQVQHFSQGGGYPPSSAPPQNLPPNSGPNLIVRNPQFMRNHPYGELIEKLASMGFRPDHVVGVIQRMEESGQPIDFNAVLDRLNVHSSGAPQRGWSG